MPDFKTTTPAKLASEIGNTYASNNDRYIVSLIVGYADASDSDDGVDSPEAAAAAALELTRDLGSLSTHWYVHDRKTGETRLLEQGDFEDVETI